MFQSHGWMKTYRLMIAPSVFWAAWIKICSNVSALARLEVCNCCRIWFWYWVGASSESSCGRQFLNEMRLFHFSFFPRASAFCAVWSKGGIFGQSLSIMHRKRMKQVKSSRSWLLLRPSSHERSAWVLLPTAVTFALVNVARVDGSRCDVITVKKSMLWINVNHNLS